MKFIQDMPRNLNVDEDHLNTKAYSDILEKILKDSSQDLRGKSFTIGLFGEWGFGKSSIIETT